MKPSLLLLSLGTLALVLSGCHAPLESGADDEADDDTHAITLTVRDPPGTVTAGEGFTMTVDVESEHETTSVHSGFHWSYNSTAGRTGLKGTDFDGASPHVTTETEFPGAYTIPEWTIQTPGTIYARAHTNAEGADWFGDEFTIVVEAA